MMHQTSVPISVAPARTGHAGLRMTADEFLQFIDKGMDYELVDGVVLMTPSPSPLHQRVAFEIGLQIGLFLRSHPIGEVFPEMDICLGKGPTGADLVYRPELVFFRRERLIGVADRLIGPPDLVVEVISPGSRLFDLTTKKSDYERTGVREYWLIDPEEKSFKFFRIRDGQFFEIPVAGDEFRSEALAGMVLDLALVREAFEPWT